MTTTGKCREPNLNNGDSNVCNQVALQLSFIPEKWDKVFKNGASKICGRQSLKNLKEYGLLKEIILLQMF